VTAWLFYLFGAIAVAGALGMLLNVRNTVAGALSLVGTMVALGAIYVLLEAYFVGALQVLVYAGAIVVLFLFVVMLLNLRGEDFGPERQRSMKVVASLLGGLVLLQFVALLPGAFGAPATLPEGFGGYRQVGLALYTDYVLLVEIASLMLLAAIVGALILAKRDID
jgi:NADH-quinone oxidoreductase subunit J